MVNFFIIYSYVLNFFFFFSLKLRSHKNARNKFLKSHTISNSKISTQSQGLQRFSYLLKLNLTKMNVFEISTGTVRYFFVQNSATQEDAGDGHEQPAGAGGRAEAVAILPGEEPEHCRSGWYLGTHPYRYPRYMHRYSFLLYTINSVLTEIRYLPVT